MKASESIKQQFGSWFRLFEDYIESSEMDTLFGHIKQRSQSGHRILPDSPNVFKAFRECPMEDLKVIICGISPYHTTYKIKGEKVDRSIADGLCMGCSDSYREKGLQPSLDTFYRALEDTYSDGFDPDMEKTGDLTYLAKQGVLLYNVGLTVEENKACSMNKYWESFDRFFWTKIVNQYMRGVPCIFMGSEAHKSANYLTPMLHYPFLISHPASIAYSGAERWDYEDVFKKVDSILWQNNGLKINWIKKRCWQDSTKSSYRYDESKVDPEKVKDCPF